MEEPKVSTPKEVVDNEDMTKKKRLEDLKKLKEKFSKGNGLLIFFIFQFHDIIIKQWKWKQND